MSQRPEARGTFLWRGGEKLYLRGVTYGSFALNSAGEPFPEPATVAHDLARMRTIGINALRTYTPPPRWLLDAAERHGLSVLCGLPWEQHVAFLDEADRRARIDADVRQAVRAAAGHAAVLGFAIGNEIPGDIVRWYGRRRVERFLARLAATVRAEDPAALVTYVNYPTTEYLQLPFVDFHAFNVYLERRERLESYLARLQNLAGHKPLVMAEVGLDSRRQGLDTQAETLAWQVASVFAAGCAGCFVFAWTDAWHRGGADIDDWDFGLVDRERCPKPALVAVREAYASAPFGRDRPLPRVSVAICTRNGARTLAGALSAATQLDYPEYEVIVVDDGSTDESAVIANGYDVRLIRTENRGLSAARNTAWRAATGAVVAYTDDDARPDQHWLRYVVDTIERGAFAGAGGPNLAPRGDGVVADCVANAPGGPNHVLVDDVTAEHVPGCNMVFRRSVLEEIGGFDERFRAAGDDVDICWRVQEAGHRIGFSPAAIVWHHRRNEVAAYWKQQQGYGKAEALLEAKWPARYDELGHLTWRGRIYGPGQLVTVRVRPDSVYHGRWGLAPFQSLYARDWGPLAVAATPEWYLLALGLALLAALAPLWPPALWTLPVLALVLALPVAHAVLGAAQATFAEHPRDGLQAAQRYLLTAWLHAIQPLARLKGRLQHGLTPWRRRSSGAARWALPRRSETWSEAWQAREVWLAALERELRDAQAITRQGGDFDDWDLDVRGGLFGGVRVASMLEEHGRGRQLLRLAVRPRFAPPAAVVPTVALLALLATADGAMLAAGLLAGVSALGGWLVARDVGHAAALAHRAAARLRETADGAR